MVAGSAHLALSSAKAKPFTVTIAVAVAWILRTTAAHLQQNKGPGFGQRHEEKVEGGGGGAKHHSNKGKEGGGGEEVGCERVERSEGGGRRGVCVGSEGAGAVSWPHLALFAKEPLWVAVLVLVNAEPLLECSWSGCLVASHVCPPVLNVLFKVCKYLCAPFHIMCAHEASMTERRFKRKNKCECVSACACVSE